MAKNKSQALKALKMFRTKLEKRATDNRTSGKLYMVLVSDLREIYYEVKNYYDKQ